jgi:hypothetical protein
MYMSLATSLAVDLGLDPNGFNSYDDFGLVEHGNFTLAAKRAYLGCYFLSVS